MSTPETTAAEAGIRERVQAAQAKIAQAKADEEAARAELAAALADGSDEGLSYSALGAIAGYTKQHAGELVQTARAAR